MKVLVTVASKHGSTRQIAEAVAEELRHSALDVDFMDVSEAGGVAGYDAVVFGSAIYAGNWLPEARYFAEGFREDLAAIPVWLFSSGPLGAVAPQPPDDPARLAAPMGDVHVRDHKVFVGKLDPAVLGLGERLITKVVGAPAGDFRDWDEIRGWAREIAADLTSMEAAVQR